MDLIKERLYYTIGEVASILNLNASTIRYWERYFPILKPSKRTGTSKRKFDLNDIQTIFKIKTILKNDKKSIKKAQLLIHNWKPEISYEEFKKLIDASNRPKIIISDEKFDKFNEILLDIKRLITSIR